MIAYSTTFATADLGGPRTPPEPYPPEGEGWEMCGSAAAATSHDCVTIYWFWKRIPEAKTRVPCRATRIGRDRDHRGAIIACSLEQDHRGECCFAY